MAEPEDLEQRVAALESQVRELDGRVRGSEQDAAAARVLAGGADRDVTEVREEIRAFRSATTSSFNAMRDDLNDLRGQVHEGFDRMEDGFRRIDGEFNRVDNAFIEIRGRLDAAAVGQQQIVTLLNTIIGGSAADDPSLS